MKTALSIRLRRLLWLPVRIEAYRQVAKWLKAVRHSRQTQARVLEELVGLVAGSDFARDYGLDRVRTIDDLRAAMPVAGYERVAPYVNRVMEGHTEALFAAGTRVHMFAMTSGTTGAPKLIPVTSQLLAAYRLGWHVWGVHAYHDNWDAFGAKLLQITSRPDEERSPSGLPVGAMSGMTAQSQRWIVRWLYALSPEVGFAGDIETKYYLACRLGLAHQRIMPLTANLSTLLALAQAMDRHKEDLLRDLADGTLKKGLALERGPRERIERRLKPNPRRARDLEAAAKASGNLYPKDAWDLPLIGTWKGGTLSLYLREMPHYWGDAPIRDIGLIASEGRFSIPLQTEGCEGALEVAGTVYEFMPESEAGKENPETLLPHETERGQRYFLVLTTPSGLFRYNISDVVEVDYFLGEAPVIRFLNKGQHVSNLTGEKVTEFQAVTAVNGAIGRLGLPIGSYCLCPTWDTTPYYSLLVEEGEVNETSGPALAAAVEAAIQGLNVEYRQKRSSSRLGPVRVRTIPAGSWNAYDEAAIQAARGRADQYKHKFIAGSPDFEKTFRTIASYGPRDEEVAR